MDKQENVVNDRLESSRCMLDDGINRYVQYIEYNKYNQYASPYHLYNKYNQYNPYQINLPDEHQKQRELD